MLVLVVALNCPSWPQDSVCQSHPNWPIGEREKHYLSVWYGMYGTVCTQAGCLDKCLSNVIDFNVSPP